MTNDDEWQEARATIGRFDQNLADVRKYGFTLVTALLGLDAFLNASGTGISPEAKVAVTMVSVALLLALFGLDRYYVSLVQGGVQRAVELERGILRNRPPELSDVIIDNARRSATGVAVVLLYLAFLAGTVALGFSSLAHDTDVDASGVFQSWGRFQAPSSAALARFQYYWQLDGWTWSAIAFSFAVTLLAWWYWGRRRHATLDLTASLSTGDDDLNSFLLWLIGAGALATLLLGFVEAISGDHLLRDTTLAGLFGAEAIVGYALFVDARSKVRLLVNQPAASIDEIVWDPAIRRLRVRGSGLTQVTDMPPALYVWIDNIAAQNGGFGVTNGPGSTLEIALPPFVDPRYHHLWRAGSLYVQLRDRNRIVVTGMTALLDAALVAQVNPPAAAPAGPVHMPVAAGPLAAVAP